MAGLEWSRRPRRGTFSREQKAALALLFGIGILGIIFGFRSFPANLRRPFDIQLAAYKGPEFLTQSQQESREIERQKTTDTDEDGLTDYDELYVYKTSPYLQDSDSDGFDDKTELYSGNDPNCPTNKDCGRTLVQSATAVDATVDASQILSGVLSIDPEKFKGVTLDSASDIQEFFGSLGVEEVKAMLKSQGVPQETIDQLNDEQLMGIFEAAIAQASASGQFSSITDETPEDEMAPDESSEEAME